MNKLSDRVYQLDSHQDIKLEPWFTPYTKMTPNESEDLSVKSETSAR